MNAIDEKEQLEILGPEYERWQGWPRGALTLYSAVEKEQWHLWREAGSPKPAPDKLMRQIDAVMYAALETDLGKLLSRSNPTLLADWETMLREHQHYDGMLSTADMIPAL